MTFTGHVASTSVTATVPSGTLQFGVDGAALGPPVTLTSGNAAVVVSTLSVSPSHTVTATYSGDTQNAGSAGTLAGGQTVNKANTTTTIGSSDNPATAGTPISFTATVIAVSPGAGTPTRQVNFVIDGGSPMPATLNGSGVATLSGVSLAAGSHSVVAQYLGDANFVSSNSTTLTQVVNGFATTTTVSSSTNPSVFGQPVTFTAIVSVGPNGTPTGNVQFGVDGAALGSPVTLTSGNATSPVVSTLSVGIHTVTATYSGDTQNVGSAGTLAGGQTVNKGATTTTLTSDNNPSIVGTPVTFTATVGAIAPSTGTPTGHIQFFIDGSTFGSPVVLSGGAATSPADTALGVGTHSVTATYTGDPNFVGSLSGTLSQVVNVAPATPGLATTAASSPAQPASGGTPPSVPGTTTDTATLTPPPPSGFGAAPTGTITFNLYGPFPPGASLSCTGAAFATRQVPVNGPGPYTTPTAVDLTSPGTYTWVATYSGDNNYTGSSNGCGDVSETVVFAQARNPTPTSEDDCKNGGWRDLTGANGASFKNQGDCVSYVATGGKNLPAGP